MLVLSRKHREAVVVGGTAAFKQLLTVTVLEISAGRVKLGFEVASEVPVHRREVWERLQEQDTLDRPVGDIAGSET
jgi:carbon storage regulator